MRRRYLVDPATSVNPSPEIASPPSELYTMLWRQIKVTPCVIRETREAGNTAILATRRYQHTAMSDDD
jgi:hypothetical protein